MDTTALGMLLQLRSAISLNKGKATIITLDNGVRRELRKAHFDRLFSIETRPRPVTTTAH
jgi:anti-anti-sigma regulatory factor